MARGGLSSGDLFGWREPVLPRRPGRAPRRGRRGLARRTAPGSSSPRTRRRASRSCSARPATPVAVVERVAEAPPPGAITLIERSLNGGFVGGPDGLAFVTDRELFGTVRVRRPEGAPAGRPARHPRAPDARRPRRPHRPRRRPLRADAPARRRRRGARLPRAVVRRRRPDLRPGRADRPGHAATRAASGRRSRKLGGTDWLRDQAARPQGGRRPRRGAPRAVRRAGRRARATRSRPTRRGRPRWRRRSRTRRRIDQLRAVGRGQGRHGADPADGPARRRRRRLRQDRGRAAGRVQGDPGRQAGRGPRPDDGPRGAAPRDVRAAVRGLPARGPAAVAVRAGRREQEATIAGLGDGIGRHRHRDAPAALARTSRSATSAWSSSTRSSGSGSPPRSGSSSSGARSTC